MLQMKFLGQWFKFWLKSHAYTNTAENITYSHICRCKYMRKVKQWDCTLKIRYLSRGFKYLYKKARPAFNIFTKGGFAKRDTSRHRQEENNFLKHN